MEKTDILRKLIKLIDNVKLMFDGDKKCTIKEKSQGNYLTSLDVEVERFLKSSLRDILPDAGFISEESPAEIKERNWIIDPIDGTGNFIYGFPYTVSIALSNENSETEIGVVYCHSTDELFYAVSGCGASLRKGSLTTSIHVKHFPEDEGIIIFGVPYDRSKTHKIFSMVEKLYHDASDVKRIGPASLDICRVAEGNAKMYLELDLNIWDYAAGELILKEAGGHTEINDDLRIFKA